MTRSRSVAVCLAIIVSLIGLARPATAALQGTPAPFGVAVPILNTDGVEVAQITVTSADDPFAAYQAADGPTRGYRFVLLHVSVENTGDANYSFDPHKMVLADSDGFLFARG